MGALLQSLYEYMKAHALTHSGFITTVEALDDFLVSAGIPFSLGSPATRAGFRKSWMANFDAEEDRVQNEAPAKSDAQTQYQANAHSSNDVDTDDAEPEVLLNSSSRQNKDSIFSWSTLSLFHSSFSASPPTIPRPPGQRSPSGKARKLQSRSHPHRQPQSPSMRRFHFKRSRASH
jgi:hypothetical protein